MGELPDHSRSRRCPADGRATQPLVVAFNSSTSHAARSSESRIANTAGPHELCPTPATFICRIVAIKLATSALE